MLYSDAEVVCTNAHWLDDYSVENAVATDGSSSYALERIRKQELSVDATPQSIVGAPFHISAATKDMASFRNEIQRFGGTQNGGDSAPLNDALYEVLPLNQDMVLPEIKEAGKSSCSNFSSKCEEMEYAADGKYTSGHSGACHQHQFTKRKRQSEESYYDCAFVVGNQTKKGGCKWDSINKSDTAARGCSIDSIEKKVAESSISFTSQSDDLVHKQEKNDAECDQLPTRCFNQRERDGIYPRKRPFYLQRIYFRPATTK